MRFLARQGLTVKGNDESEGNLMQLLELQSEDVSVLQAWHSHTTESQNEVLEMMSQNEVLETMSHNILHRITDHVSAVCCGS